MVSKCQHFAAKRDGIRFDTINTVKEGLVGHSETGLLLHETQSTAELSLFKQKAPGMNLKLMRCDDEHEICVSQ